MNRKLLFLAMLSLGILTGCGAPVRIYSDIDESGSFERYASYNFLDFTDGNKKTITDMELERIKVAFAREIEQKGLRFSENNADVSLQITVYHRLATTGYYYYPYRHNYMERAIAVDMYDNHTQKHVWHCAAVGELDYDPQARAAKLPELAADIFKKYPLAPASEI
ncbi:MAG: DUF4136 domain-containing protein [Bacteroidota bacterium]